MPEWVRVAAIGEIPEGSGKEFTVGDRIVALYHVDGRYFSLDGICPHAGGPLAEGALEGCIVTCPWHGWQFDVTTGQHCLSDPIRQQTFPVRLEGNDIFIALP